MNGTGSRASVVVVRDLTDPVAGREPVDRAVERVRGVLVERGVDCGELRRPEPADADVILLVAGADAGPAVQMSRDSGIALPRVPETLALVPGRTPGPRTLLACGSDVRGLVYAVLELADRAEQADDPLGALRVEKPVVERPANAVRSVARLFCSELEDLSWFRDEGFWRRYLAMLVAQRFNRFSLTLGLGYNFHRNATDAYLYFPYPFLVRVPGYDVRVPQLPDEERERNLAALRFISEEAAACGLDMQLGLWNHAYEWLDSPNARHTIEGLTLERHAAYCRDALSALLEACPGIGGLTFRIHGEGGVPEGSWSFWQTVFGGVMTSGRRVGLDLHAKGLDQETLRIALDTGLPVTVSPKFWAEHMGLPYHQTAIRERERLPREELAPASEWHRYMSVSEGSRPFTRYGYGDFLREDRTYDLVFRLWPGTQRLLLWGDPAMAAAYGRAASLAGSGGLEWCEPLTFKGREGSGLPGSRTGYAETSLVPGDDWEKYAYAYRLFGRLTYDPDAPPDCWQRYLRARFGGASEEAEAALASASRILPLVTTAHHPSASNNYYWPEVYTDMPIVVGADGIREHPYVDTPEPRRFGTVSALDPEVFSSAADLSEELRTDERSGRRSPLWVARVLEELAESAAVHLARMERPVRESEPAARRWSIDVAIQIELGHFFAGKLRAAALYEMHATTGNACALREALAAYRRARDAWEALARRAGAYAPDLTFGPQPRLRGHWADRLQAIEADLADMEAQAASGGEPAREEQVDLRRLLEAADPTPPDVEVIHSAPHAFRPGEPLTVELELRGAGAPELRSVTLRFRPMNQSLSYIGSEMTADGRRFFGSIPGEALAGAYPLQYFFVLRDGWGAWRWPDLGADLCGRPYLVLRPGGAAGGPPGWPRLGLMRPPYCLYGQTWERYHSDSRAPPRVARGGDRWGSQWEADRRQEPRSGSRKVAR